MTKQKRVVGVVCRDTEFAARLGLALEWRGLASVVGASLAELRDRAQLYVLDAQAEPDWLAHLDSPLPLLVLDQFPDEAALIRALQGGALACLAKPLSAEVVAAQAAALALLWERHEQENEPMAALQVGELSVDPASRRVSVQGRLVRLTTAEFELLAYMARYPGSVLTRDELYQNTRGISHNGLDRSLDLRIARLRKKLGDDARNPHFILAIRGVGYLLAEANET